MTRSSAEATAAFYNTHPATRLFRWGLGASQRLWPALAVRVAYRLFGTPLPPRWLTRRRAWPAGWAVTPWPFEDASLTLYTRPDLPDVPDMAPGPLVLLVHGWGGHAGQLLALADALQAQGLRPVILEMPAHGRNSGPTSNLPQFTRAIEYAAARLQQQGLRLDALVAHSMGASAAAFVASRGLALRRLVLLAPAASLHAYSRLFAQMFGLSEHTRAAMQKRFEAREGVLMPQFEPQAVGPRITQPTLVVHDRHDSINGFADGVAFSQAIPGARLLATQELGHRRILKDSAVLCEVAAFLA